MHVDQGHFQLEETQHAKIVILTVLIVKIILVFVLFAM